MPQKKSDSNNKGQHALLHDLYSLDFFIRKVKDAQAATPKEKRCDILARLNCSLVPRVIQEYSIEELEELNRIIKAGIKVILGEEKAKKIKPRKQDGKYKIFVNGKLTGTAITKKAAWKIVDDRPFGALYEVHDDSGIVEEFIPF